MNPKSISSSRFKQLPRESSLSQFLSRHDDSNFSGFITRLDRSPIRAKRWFLFSFKSKAVIDCVDQACIRQGVRVERRRLGISYRPRCCYSCQGPPFYLPSPFQTWPLYYSRSCHYVGNPSLITLHHCPFLLGRMSLQIPLRLSCLRAYHQETTQSWTSITEEPPSGRPTFRTILAHGHSSCKPRTTLFQ